MTAKQKEFLGLLAAYMNGGPERPISEFIQSKLKPQELEDCLESFMGVSKKYGINHRSMNIFWALSTLALARSQPYFALKYEFLVRPEAGTEWSSRYNFLRDDQKKEEARQIAAQKKKATYLDFRRLQLYQETEADIAAGNKAHASDAKANAKAKKGFVGLFHAYMAARNKQATHEITEFIQKLNGPQLEQCLQQYLEASKQYLDTSTFSLDIFFGISSLALHRSGGYFALKFEVRTKPEEKTTLSQRYAFLQGRQKTILADDLAAAKKRTRVLDELRFAYFSAHHKDPDDRALRAFEPPCKPDLLRELSGALAHCDRQAESLRVRDFLRAWDELAALYEQKDILTLVAMLKQSREWLRIDKVMRDEVYWYGVGVLFNHLLVHRPEVYKRGFNDEEKRFFLNAELSRHPYFGDFENRLWYLTSRRDFRGFAGVSKDHAAIELYATKRNMKVATMADTQRVWGLLDELRKNGPAPGQKLRIPVTQPEGILKERSPTVGIGDTYGDLTIVWLQDERTAYVECRRLEKVLFIMHETDYGHQLGRLSLDKFYDVLWEDTKHLLVLIPLFFQILSYIPDLVSGGLMGLAKSIAQQWLISETTEAIFGDSPTGDAVAFAATIATGHLTRAESQATKNISRELRALEQVEHALVVPKATQIRLAQGHVLDDGAKRSIDLHTRGVDVEVKSPHVSSLVKEERALEGAALAERRTTVAKDKLARQEVVAEREKVAAGAERKGADKKRANQGEGQHKGESDKSAAKRKAAQNREPEKSEPKKQGDKREAKKTEPEDERGKAEPEARRDQRGTNDAARSTANNGKRQAAAQAANEVITLEFTRGGIRYRVRGTRKAFAALESTGPTRFQVYEIRDASGNTIYVGIVGGETRARNALDRLPEHLYTKDGEFIGDAASIHVRGKDLDERFARALEDDLITEKKPKWNKRERDPQSYRRKYRQAPSMEEVRRASNTYFSFVIDLLP